MDTIYLDPKQCDRFDVAYYKPAKLVIAADTLLQSKGGDGYDSEHAAFLKPLGGKTLVLNSTGNGPGWFAVTKIL